MTYSRLDTPGNVAEKIKADLKVAPQAARATSVNYSVSLSSSNGFYQLNWSADVIQKWDWVGLYPNADVPDSAYITGDNWQWGLYGNSYVTQTPVTSGHQARYLVWDAQSDTYVSVARSNIL